MLWDTESLAQAESLDAIASEVHETLKVHAVLITRLSDDIEHFLAVAGVRLPPQFRDGVPVSHAVCYHTAAMNFPLVVDDAYSHPLLRKNPAVMEFNISAYLGAPIHGQDGTAIGGICAVGFHQRRWKEAEIQYIVAAGRIVDAFLRKND